MLISYPCKIDNVFLFVHGENRYCVKTILRLSEQDELTVGYNNSSTLYTEQNEKCAWYVIKRADGKL